MIIETKPRVGSHKNARLGLTQRMCVGVWKRTKVAVLAQGIIDPVGKSEPAIEDGVLDEIERRREREAEAEGQKKASKKMSVFVSNSSCRRSSLPGRSYESLQQFGRTSPHQYKCEFQKRWRWRGWPFRHQFSCKKRREGRGQSNQFVTCMPPAQCFSGSSGRNMFVAYLSPQGVAMMDVYGSGTDRRLKEKEAKRAPKRAQRATQKHRFPSLHEDDTALLTT